MLAAAMRLAVDDPVGFAWTVGGRIAPTMLYDRLERAAVRAGFDRLWLVLSFDCDTEDDIAVAWDVHARLLDLGVLAHYAVPGDLLYRGADVYGRIATTGAEFFNHGGRKHTFFDQAIGEHRSCFFYDAQPRETVEADIRAGHAAVREVLGITPHGFRSPHFGTFQKPGELAFLHGVLQRLGYAWSSSTTPQHAFRHGPAFVRNGLLELPVSARYGRPMEILDTWSCYRAPARRLGPADYLNEARALATEMSGRVGLLNLYADPCHIAGEDTFFDAIRTLRTIAEPTSFRELVTRLQSH